MSDLLSGSGSDYQRESHAFYGEVRGSHTAVYSSFERMEAEMRETRYSHLRPARLEGSVRNLSSLISLLHQLLGPRVSGIDFGCGSHWFVDFARNDPTYAWSVVGYDVDSYAIELAQQRFPRSAEFYRCIDPIRDGLPNADESQDFIFSNAVFQHFSNDEAHRVLSEMARVLRSGGLCMLSFKCWPDQETATDMIQSMRIVDRAHHKAYLYDPAMKAAIDQMPAQKRGQLEARWQDGWRLLHLFPVEQVLQIAADYGLGVERSVAVDGGPIFDGVIKFRSGRNIETACVLLRKPAGQA